MRNVTQIFRNAISSHTDWMINTFYKVIEVLRKKDVRISFWEGEENWASILIDNKTVGYIWRKYPLIVIKKNSVPNLISLLSNQKIINYLEVDSLDKELLRIEDSELAEFLDGYSNLSSFTIEDIWFYTNSR